MDAEPPPAGLPMSLNFPRTPAGVRLDVWDSLSGGVGC